MRVTDRALFEVSHRAVETARARQQKASLEVATGTRVQHVWDDAAAAGMAVGERLQLSRQQMVETTAERAQNELRSADGALGQAVELMSRARELAIQLSNDTYSAQNRADAAVEVEGLIRGLVAAANTEVNGRFLFAGFRDGSPPFDAAGVYSGDGNVRQLEVAPGLLQPVSVAGDQVFKGAGGGVDLFAVLDGLRVGLAANDLNAIRGSLAGLDSATIQLSAARATAGASDTLLDVAMAASRLQQDQATERLSELLDADAIQSATALALAERALDASLTAAARVGKMTLLDKM